MPEYVWEPTEDLATKICERGCRLWVGAGAAQKDFRAAKERKDRTVFVLAVLLCAE